VKSDAAGAKPDRRLLVVEEALKNQAAHFYEYVKSVAELNASIGGETVVVSHAATDPAICRELDAHPLFERSNWDGVYNHPKAWKRYLGIVRHNWYVYRVMNRFVKQHGPFDLLFAPTVVIYQLIGWRMLMARHGGRGVKQIVLLFRNNAGSYPADSSTPVFKRSTAILKWALQSFRGLIAKGQARFVTDSTRLATEYRLLCGIEPEVWPSPRVAAYAELAEDARAADAPVVFSCLGPARFEKGIDVMQAAIKAYLAAHPEGRARFVIQWNAPIVDALGAPYMPDPALRADPRVTLIEQSMSSAAYDAAVEATDVMLLPYRRSSYFARISGVAVEAVTAGVPVIYTRDTWCEDLVIDVGTGIGVSDNDVAGLADAIATMAEDYPRYRAEARSRAVKARQSHSGDAFLDKLWGKA
jgi:glycosyltransferase involved in cell wall biosynthesis